MKTYGLGLLAALALSACSPDIPSSLATSAPGIVGGEEVTKGSDVAKHVVALVGKSEDSQFLCTGVIIASDAILTAGHCGAQMSAGAVIFSTDLSTASNKQIREINHVDVQPQFEETVEHLSTERKVTASRLPKNWGDLAIVRFSGNLPRGYSPVAFDEQELSDDYKVILAGFGLLNGEDEKPAAILNSVEISIKKAKYSRTEFSVDQREGKGACHGDSGGPAFVEREQGLVLVGITSRGSDAKCKRLGIYTKVSAFQDWIESLLR